MSGDQIPLTPMKLHRAARVVQDLVMAVFCAVCEQDLHPGEKFALRGMYVIHRRCQGLPIKNEAYLESVRHQVAELDLAVSRERRDHEQQFKRLNDDVSRWKERALAAESRATTSENAHLYWAARAAGKEEEIQQLQERLRTRIPAPPPVQAQAPLPVASGEISPAEPAEEESTPDDTATRFRLLEFD